MEFPHKGDKNKLCHLKQKGSSVWSCPHWSHQEPQGICSDSQPCKSTFGCRADGTCVKQDTLNIPCPFFFFFFLTWYTEEGSTAEVSLYIAINTLGYISVLCPSLSNASMWLWVLGASWNTGMLLLQVFNPARLLRLFLLHPSFSWKYLHCHNSIQIFRAANRQLLKTLSCRCLEKWILWQGWL